MSAPKVAVVDYGVGNLLSVTRALAHVGAEAVLVSDAEAIRAAGLLLLPGVGAFGHGMAELAARGLIEPLQAHAAAGKPLLGICLGAQLLLSESHEFGSHRGLGLIPGHVVAVPARGADGEPHRIPHIGWADLEEPVAGRWRGSVLAETSPGRAVYFVHSYHPSPVDPAHILAQVDYDGVKVTAAVAKDVVTGCQFHPEKSGETGLAILRRFVGTET